MDVAKAFPLRAFNSHEFDCFVFANSLKNEFP